MTSLRGSLEIAQRTVDRCLMLARLSEDENRTTRTFLTPPMREAHRLVQGWMEDAGMTVTVDAIGNLRGVFRGTRSNAPVLLMGSHLDTVPGAGAFDGVLGIMLALSLVEAIDHQTRPEFGIEIIAFSEEEGVRFGVPFLGSKALAGSLDPGILQRQDARGITVTQAIRDFGLDPAGLKDAAFGLNALGYIEFHIEQGPVLDSLNLPVGVVEAIVGQSRLEVTFQGKTNHAGTTPMQLRRDALAAASEWILEVEREAQATAGLVATVGWINAVPGAANVIPGEVRASLDVRHRDDSVRTLHVRRILDCARAIVERRQLQFSWELRQEQAAVGCDSELTNIMARSVETAGYPAHRMVSGAGHDAMVMASRMPVAMLFVRSPGGISHHSDETVRIEDVASSVEVAQQFLKHLGSHYASTRIN
jgi:allantoate deiminase